MVGRQKQSNRIRKEKLWISINFEIIFMDAEEKMKREYTKRKNNREEIIQERFCDRCDFPIDQCICEEIDRPERRQHKRTTK